MIPYQIEISQNLSFRFQEILLRLDTLLWQVWHKNLQVSVRALSSRVYIQLVDIFKPKALIGSACITDMTVVSCP